MHSPLEQFRIRTIVDLNLFGYDMSFTNSSLFICASITLIILFFYLGTARSAVRAPGMLQSAAELLYIFVFDMLNANVKNDRISRKFMPLIFSLFMVVLVGNLLGMLPYAFTFTSHIAVTFCIAMIIFIVMTITGFVMHGTGFFSFFLPAGTPLILAPLMIMVEMFTFLSRPITLAVRLAANMTAGHVLLKVLASFVIMMQFFGWIPIPFMVLFTGFEIFVSILQAYIFTILACSYIGDAVNLH